MSPKTCKHHHTTKHVDSVGMMREHLGPNGPEVWARVLLSHVVCDDCGMTLSYQSAKPSSLEDEDAARLEFALLSIQRALQVATHYLSTEENDEHTE